MTLTQSTDQPPDGDVQIGCDARGVDSEFDHIFNLGLSIWVDKFCPGDGGVPHTDASAPGPKPRRARMVPLDGAYGSGYQRRNQCQWSVSQLWTVVISLVLLDSQDSESFIAKTDRTIATRPNNTPKPTSVWPVTPGRRTA